MAWPTTSDPRTEFVTVRLTVTEAADIDWLRTVTGESNRSTAVRNAVARVIEAEKRKAARASKTPNGTAGA